MYSKEQIDLRLKIGASISSAEMVIIIKSMMQTINELELKYNELSKNRGVAAAPVREVVQATPIRPQVKQ
jgi:hypothetical protein